MLGIISYSTCSIHCVSQYQFNTYAAGGQFANYKMMQKNFF